VEIGNLLRWDGVGGDGKVNTKNWVADRNIFRRTGRFGSLGREKPKAHPSDDKNADDKKDFHELSLPFMVWGSQAQVEKSGFAICGDYARSPLHEQFYRLWERIYIKKSGMNMLWERWRMGAPSFLSEPT
jgi:hypothetical protein